MNRKLLFVIALLFACFTGCGSGLDSPELSKEAFVGPSTLKLLAELSPRATVVATLSHGDKVEIVAQRRRFAKVRATGGEEGWVDGRMLLDAAQMGRMRRLALHAAQLPSQGNATVFDTLNVHTTPNRTSPSFFQLREGLAVQVVAHGLEPRAPYEPPLEDQEFFPKLLYATAPETPPPAAGADDWSLIRLPDGRAGWALTRLLTMAIPDEVAQYAEGQRITAYFALGTAEDKRHTKHHWLWTTRSRDLRPYEFDSFRVFIWSVRRQRYETVYIERNIIGYYPVEVEQATGSSGLPGFSLLIRDKDDGELYRRTYEFSGYRVRLLNKVLWEPPAEDDAPKVIVQAAPGPDEAGLLPNLRQKVRTWLQ